MSMNVTKNKEFVFKMRMLETLTPKTAFIATTPNTHTWNPLFSSEQNRY